jgi:hypothetical protein
MNIITVTATAGVVCTGLGFLALRQVTRILTEDPYQWKDC